MYVQCMLFVLYIVNCGLYITLKQLTTVSPSPPCSGGSTRLLLHTLCCILHIYLCLSFQMTRDTFWFPRQCGAQPIEVEIFAVEAAAVVVVVVDEVVAGERLGTGIEVEVMVEFIHRPACWLLVEHCGPSSATWKRYG